MRILLYVAPIVLTIYCLVDAITSRDDEVRHLGKVYWIVLILLFPFVGSIAWLVAGRPVRTRAAGHHTPVPDFPEYDRPGRVAATDTGADEEFLKQVRERAEQQRRDYEARKRAERAAEEAALEERRRRRKGADPDPEPS